MTSGSESKSSLLTAINIIEDIIELSHRKKNRFSHDENVSAEWNEVNEKLYICWNQLKCVETNIDDSECCPPRVDSLKEKFLKKFKR